MGQVIQQEPKFRHFGGKTEGFKDRSEQVFEQRHLRAYIKGWKQFDYGFQDTPQGRQRMSFKVMEVWK